MKLRSMINTTVLPVICLSVIAVSYASNASAMTTCPQTATCPGTDYTKCHAGNWQVDGAQGSNGKIHPGLYQFVFAGDTPSFPTRYVWCTYKRGDDFVSASSHQLVSDNVYHTWRKDPKFPFFLACGDRQTPINAARCPLKQRK